MKIFSTIGLPHWCYKQGIRYSLKTQVPYDDDDMYLATGINLFI